MTYIHDTRAYGVMCTATYLDGQPKGSQHPEVGRNKGLELFGEAARQLGEQRPAQHQRHHSHQGAGTQVAPAGEG